MIPVDLAAVLERLRGKRVRIVIDGRPRLGYLNSYGPGVWEINDRPLLPMAGVEHVYERVEAVGPRGGRAVSYRLAWSA